MIIVHDLESIRKEVVNKPKTEEENSITNSTKEAEELLKVIKDSVIKNIKDQMVDEDFQDMFDKIVKWIDDNIKSVEDLIKFKNDPSAVIKELGLYTLNDIYDYIQETFQITFGNRIRRQIEAYVPIYIACGGTENEALDDILAKKVLRKLESQNPVYVKSKSEELIGKLNEVFGDGNMPICEAYIKKLANNA